MNQAFHDWIDGLLRSKNRYAAAQAEEWHQGRFVNGCYVALPLVSPEACRAMADLLTDLKSDPAFLEAGRKQP